MTQSKGLVSLSEILEKHSPVEMFIRFSLKKGTEFRSSRSFNLSDNKAGALMVAANWLGIPSAVIANLFVFADEGHLKLADSLKSVDGAKPFDPLLVCGGDYEFTFTLTLIKNDSVNPLRRFLDTFGDRWGAYPGVSDHWDYIQQNFLPSNPFKGDFRLKADLRALD